MLASSSPHRVLALGVENGTGIYERVALLWPVVGAAAATDPAVEAYWLGVIATRRDGQRGMVAKVAELGGLRRGLDAERATDLVVVLAGPDVYLGLVQEAGWPVPAYKAWLFTALVRELLAADQVEPDATATGHLLQATLTHATSFGLHNLLSLGCDKPIPPAIPHRPTTEPPNPF
jgi:hypothetical protein